MGMLREKRIAGYLNIPLEELKKVSKSIVFNISMLFGINDNSKVRISIRLSTSYSIPSLKYSRATFSDVSLISGLLNCNYIFIRNIVYSSMNFLLNLIYIEFTMQF